MSADPRWSEWSPASSFPNKQSDVWRSDGVWCILPSITFSSFELLSEERKKRGDSRRWSEYPKDGDVLIDCHVYWDDGEYESEGEKRVQQDDRGIRTFSCLILISSSEGIFFTSQSDVFFMLIMMRGLCDWFYAIIMIYTDEYDHQKWAEGEITMTIIHEFQNEIPFVLLHHFPFSSLLWLSVKWC